MDQISIRTAASVAGVSAGIRLRDARLAKHYRLEHLAVATGLTVAEISAIENRTSDNRHPAERVEHPLS